MQADQATLPAAKQDLDSTSYRPHLLFVLACAVIFTLFVTAYYQSSASLTSMATLREHSRQLNAVDDLLIDLLNAETGVRGYLISGKIEYLELYVDAVALLDNYLSNVTHSIDNISHMHDDIMQLASLVDRYKVVFQGLIDNKSQGAVVDAWDMYQGKVIFDELRDVISRIKVYLTFDSSTFYEQASRGQEYTRYAVFALCTAAFAFLIWLFSTQQKQAKLRKRIAQMLAQENEHLDKKVASRTHQLTRLAAQLTQVSEAEKQRLARELHDDMGASLTAAKMDAAWIASEQSENTDPTLSNRIKRLISSLDHAITLKRRLTSDLLPPLLAQLGLFEALRSLGEDLESDGDVKATINVPDTLPELDHATALAIFRIAQEATTNVRKYSQATEVALSVQIDGGKLTMDITDNGIGFDLKSVKEECFGLISMRHRAQMIAANFRVESQPGKGTSVQVSYRLKVPA